jgi:hypothetical protein
VLGIVGVYLGRLHMNVNRKPQYMVRHVLGAPRWLRAPALEEVAEEAGVPADGRF